MHRLQLKTAYSPLQFAGIRILLGGYLLYYFLQLLPHREELFSSLGMVPDVTVNTTYGISFWFISYFTSPGAISLLFFVLIATSILFSVGILRQVTALLLWVGWLILYNLNNLTIDPSLGFTGLLLLVFATVPSGEPLVLGRTISTQHSCLANADDYVLGYLVRFWISFYHERPREVFESYMDIG